MSHAESYAPEALEGRVVLVVDATTGIGRIITIRLCAAGAKVAVVGAEHRGRGDDAATNAAFLCKELAEIGMVALPYRADIERADTFRTLPAQIAADLGSVAVCVVVIPAAPCTGERTAAYRTMSATVAAALPPGARHIEIDMADRTEGHEEAAHGLVDQLLHRRPQSC
ncbi:SDR family NAD(P)-dependent oxidoreductase [Streptomyces laculatispora]|uniref:SDR family NAD(P)-dependent oxidoreductase n=1 Tax=Streptomyces laculatispora TaxID=887464 RepID=UPI001A93D3E9|nr:SDR family NAD(P)-dependent oxidoreductase [Streptomyces laculatispora]MBO0919205.1 hypothetical protein [Streptomyces laculatispora]